MALDIGLWGHNGYPVISDWVSVEDVVNNIKTQVLGDVKDTLDIIAIKWNQTWESIDERLERIFERNKTEFQKMFPDFFETERTAQEFEVVNHWKSNPDRNGRFDKEEGFQKYPVSLTQEVLSDGKVRYKTISWIFSEAA